MLRISGVLHVSRCHQSYRRLVTSSTQYVTNSNDITESKKNITDKDVDPVKAYTMFGGIKDQKGVFHYTDRKSGVGYSHYSSTIYQNRPYIWPPLRKLFNINYMIVMVGMTLLLINFEWLGDQVQKASSQWRPNASQLKSPKEQVHDIAEEPTEPEPTSQTESEDEAVDHVKAEKPKKKKIGFRERRIIEYEDRLRLYSTPDKIFRYFATLKVIDQRDESGRTFEVFMTPEDFLRSFTPGVMQPRKLGLDSFKVYQPDKYKHKFSDTSSIFYKLGENGLISFSDYLFLMTLLCTSPKDFELAFKIFDVNGDGALDREEFQKVQHLIMSQTTVGQRHRDHITPNSSFRVESNSALEAYFFGKDGTKKLPAEKFLEFQERLHDDILRMEFNRRDAVDGIDGLVSEESFAHLLLMHAQTNEKRQKIMLKRVRKKFKGGPGITFAETRAFFRFLYHIDDVDMALHFHRLAGIPVAAPLLQRVARKVTGVKLSDHVVDVVITLFDDNLDGCLSNEEMITVMRRRMQRGLERPRDTGLFRLFDAFTMCSKRMFHASSLPFH